MGPQRVFVAARAEPLVSSGNGVELTLELAPSIAPALAARNAGLGKHALADLSYGNLWLFRRPHGYRFHPGEFPCISGRTYDAATHALPLFDVANAPPQAIDALLARHGCLFPLTDREARSLDGERVAVESRRSDADYVYPADQFRDYSGRALQKKRNLMTQLTSAHEVSATPYAPQLALEALQVLQGWLDDKGKHAGDADDPACREALALAPELGLEGCLYRADGQAAGFLLAEQLQPGVWVVRFAKGLVRFKGIAQYMFHHFASQTDRRIDWLNFEQDLGLPNFRRTKLSYRPALLLDKWRAQWRQP